MVTKLYRKETGFVFLFFKNQKVVNCCSFKVKHEKMKSGLGFIKIGDYAVININNMFPVPDGEYTYVDIPKVKNPQYRKLLMTEYRINDFKLLEEKSKKFKSNSHPF